MLQIKEIPPRPESFDGALCLFELASGVGEAEIRTKFGDAVVACELEKTPAVVRFASHEAAMEAKRQGPSGLCEAMDTLYNERSYDGRQGEADRDDDQGRGWCAGHRPITLLWIARS